MTECPRCRAASRDHIAITESDWYLRLGTPEANDWIEEVLDRLDAVRNDHRNHPE